MGGTGSGGWNRKYSGTIDETIRLDASKLRKAGILDSWFPRKMSWTQRGILLLELKFLRSQDGLLVCDGTAENSEFHDPLSQTLRLVDIDTKVGGHKTLFRCPKCSRSCRHLYLSGPKFLCRDCCGLTYTSQREDPANRAWRRWRKLSNQLGGVSFYDSDCPRRPKGMHQRTFVRLANELYEAKIEVERHLDQFMSRQRAAQAD